ncbi:959_t:CDS:2 [Ambispora leptoticha]|uniref:959_t:CDS:1 n=1 Tax=Ambispora leptoticha TaxID=144679 RepID=A0A9N9BJK5_9GLOM|nr:959_t:CDS:2 [Ambispora leptoticha]
MSSPSFLRKDRTTKQQAHLAKIKPYVDRVKELPPAQLIAEDECAFYLNEAPRRAWGINLPNGEKYYLMLDNAKIHKAVKACLKKVAYCPQLNPVELIFNFLRQYVEKYEPRTLEELKYIIEKGIEELQEKDITKYFEHCLNYDFSKNEQ